MMALASGTQLGSYRITELIGAGGMGDVYRATDTVLKREVAIKILPESFTADADRLARFRREAEVLASLNHPNIAQIHGLEQSDESIALVIELIEGPTLADRIAEGPIPPDEALAIATQIAQAIEAAHDKGIVHRDLKPANIKLRPDGIVKVLDFGIAKVVEPAIYTSGRGLPAETSPAMTETGQILGTAAYMSPEQARGKPLDRRTDIWAFGAVVYEMLTGQPPFLGAEVTETVAAVLKTEPDWSALPELPPLVLMFVKQCLRKNPEQRLHDVADIRLAFAGYYDVAAAIPESRQPRPTRSSRTAWITSLAGVAIVGAGLVVTGILGPRPSVPAEIRFTVAVPPMIWPYNFAVSPDGRSFVYGARIGDEQKTRLFLRELGSLEHRELEGTDGAFAPFWSPDGRSIAFFSGESLFKMNIAGGEPERIGATSNFGFVTSGTWNDDDIILFGAGLVSDHLIYRVPAAGGVPEAITSLDAELEENGHLHPQFLPDGQHYLYVAQSSPDESEESEGALTAYVASLESVERVRLPIATDFQVRYMTGHLLYQLAGTLYAQPFDPGTLQMIGDRFRVASGVAGQNVHEAAAFAVSAGGTLLYRTGDLSVDLQFKWFDPNGRDLGTATDPGAYYQGFDLCSDGTRLAVSVYDGPNPALYTIDLTRPFRQRVTFAELPDFIPIWSYDCTQLAFSRVIGGKADVLVTNVDTTGDEGTLISSEATHWIEDWSDDGRYLVYLKILADATDFWAIDLVDNREFPVDENSWGEDEAHFSPDGNWLAYHSHESDPFEVYVRSFPDTQAFKEKISQGGGVEPRWSADGTRLYYFTPDGILMSVPVETGESFQTLADPAPVLETGMAINPIQDNYAIAPDGRILVLMPVVETAPEPLTVVVNWNVEND